jgi:hypothetical protein
MGAFQCSDMTSEIPTLEAAGGQGMLEGRQQRHRRGTVRQHVGR